MRVCCDLCQMAGPTSGTRAIPPSPAMHGSGKAGTLVVPDRTQGVISNEHTTRCAFPPAPFPRLRQRSMSNPTKMPISMSPMLARPSVKPQTLLSTSVGPQTSWPDLHRLVGSDSDAQREHKRECRLAFEQWTKNKSVQRRKSSGDGTIKKPANENTTEKLPKTQTGVRSPQTTSKSFQRSASEPMRLPQPRLSGGRSPLGAQKALDEEGDQCEIIDMSKSPSELRKLNILLPLPIIRSGFESKSTVRKRISWAAEASPEDKPPISMSRSLPSLNIIDADG